MSRADMLLVTIEVVVEMESWNMLGGKLLLIIVMLLFVIIVTVTVQASRISLFIGDSVINAGDHIVNDIQQLL